MKTTVEGKSFTARPGKFQLAPRRAAFYDIAEVLKEAPSDISEDQLSFFEKLDLIYRTLCGILYNFVPTSGHPGGSISSGRMVEGLIYRVMDYDFSSPLREDADMIVYAAGHKAMGLYAMWALRNELVRIGRPAFLPSESSQLRLDDLLGFRRNPTNETPLFRKLRAKALDGHPTCAIPFVRLATGASGVGVAAACGLALGALDVYSGNPPKVHLVEGEGGLTPGRVHEALAACATARIHNVVLHVDWNQASIDSNRVCRENGQPGDYVQWTPAELAYLHDWNVIQVPDGLDFRQVFAAQKLAVRIANQQPTAVVYRTVKGWKYGIEGKGSHGAGHKFCSEGYYASLKEFEERFQTRFPRFSGKADPESVERCFYDTLLVIRQVLEKNNELPLGAAGMLEESKKRLDGSCRVVRQDAPDISGLYAKDLVPEKPPSELNLVPGSEATLRAVLGDALNVLNKRTRGGFFGSAADLLGSTNVTNLNKDFPEGFYNSASNPGSRLIALGGICEDCMGAFMSGLSSFGRHIGATSSYAAFIAPLEHIAARLHCIGQQTQRAVTGKPYHTWIMINAHVGVKTGEDGPTHADPQPLQLLQENFPSGMLITLTPWDPQEMWPLLIAGLRARPAVLCPFVTRPPEKVLDREKLGLPPAAAAVKGLYLLQTADPSSKRHDGTVVLQGNGVATIFIQDVLPRLKEKGLNLNIYYVASAELFKLLSQKEQDRIFPEAGAYEAMGITDFTLPTMYQWVRSNEGLRRTLHSFVSGHYLGSGQAHKVLEEAGLHAEGQLKAVLDYAAYIRKGLSA